jgi:hypothetical protein
MNRPPLGVITSGQSGNFIRDDLPFLAFGLIGAGLGGAIGSRFRRDGS